MTSAVEVDGVEILNTGAPDVIHVTDNATYQPGRTYVLERAWGADRTISPSPAQWGWGTFSIPIQSSPSLIISS